MRRAGRTVALMPLVGAFAAASALVGAATYTVSRAGCAHPGHYVEHAGHTELVGGCLHRDDLPRVPMRITRANDTRP
jgi:hypothetical protein